MTIEEISPAEAIASVKKGSVFVDVREDYEIAEIAYDIDNKIEIPLGEIQTRLNEFPKDKNIIVGCRSGKRSMQACMFLKMSGYQNVQNLQGGILGWSEGGFPTK
jgi:rhodanese-related sulfurtransferase